MQALSGAMRTKIPSRPMSSTTPVTHSARVSVTDARIKVIVASTARRLARPACRVPHVPVPLFDPQGPLRPLRAELRTAVHRVLDGGAFILGPEVEAFEREWAAYLGARHAVGVANGTEAI